MSTTQEQYDAIKTGDRVLLIKDGGATVVGKTCHVFVVIDGHTAAIPATLQHIDSIIPLSGPVPAVGQ